MQIFLQKYSLDLHDIKVSIKIRPLNNLLLFFVLFLIYLIKVKSSFFKHIYAQVWLLSFFLHLHVSWFLIVPQLLIRLFYSFLSLSKFVWIKMWKFRLDVELDPSKITANHLSSKKLPFYPLVLLQLKLCFLLNKQQPNRTTTIFIIKETSFKCVAHLVCCVLIALNSCSIPIIEREFIK